MFLAPTLQPAQQSPHSVQAGCAIPAALTAGSKLTTTSGTIGAMPSAMLARLQRAKLGQLSARANRAGRSQRARPREAFLQQSVLCDLARPGSVGKHAVVGPERHAGIDERSAAEPASHEHMHVLAHAHVEQRGVRAGAVALAADLHLLAHVGELGGELARRELAAAFQHGNALAGASQAQGGHAAAVAGAHHHRVVMRLQTVERACKPRHLSSDDRRDKARRTMDRE